MKKPNLLLTFSIAIICLLVLFSFKSVEKTVTVKGTVLDAQGQPLYNVNVYIDSKDGQRFIYSEPTFTNGEYTLKFPAVDGRRVKIYFEKENYETFNKTIIPSHTSQTIHMNDINLAYIEVTKPATLLSHKK